MKRPVINTIFETYKDDKNGSVTDKEFSKFKVA